MCQERRRSGWVPRNPTPLDHAEALHYPSFGLGRTWSPSTDDDLSPSPGFLHAVLIVEGSITFATGDEQVIAPSGSVTLLDGATDARAVARTPTARFSWYFAATVLPLDRALLPVGRSVAMPEQSRNALVSATNAILNTPSDLDPDAAQYVGLSLAYLLTAGLIDGRAPAVREPAHGDLFVRAHAAIEQHFHDPDLTVGRLARELSVSRSALHAAFAESGSTPRRHLEERRLAEARRLAVDGRLSSQELARRTGFASSTHFLRTLRRAGARGTSGRSEHENSTR